MYVCVCGGGVTNFKEYFFIYYANIIMYKYYCIALISLNDFNVVLKYH